MSDNNKQQNPENTSQQTSNEPVMNPFENKQPVEKDLQQSQEEVKKEQEFKEALTERD